MVCKMFVKILKNTIQERKAKYWLYLMIWLADMHNKRKLNSRVTDVFIICRKLNISLVFITQSYSKVPKDVRLDTTLFL